MTVYSTSSSSARVIWPDPIEPILQILSGYTESLPGWKRPDVGLAERLFIGAILNISKEQRPWGVVNWLANV